MKKFVLALLIVSMLALACNADHHHHDHKHESEKTKVEKSPVKKAVVQDLKDLKKEHRSIVVNKVPNKKRQPQVRARNYQLKNTVRSGPPKVNLKKLPLKPLPPQRKSRRISPLKKQLSKPHRNHRRVLKKVRGLPKVHHHQKVAHVQHKRPAAPAVRVNNFSRFLRAFGRQLNRPVLPRFVAKQPHLQTRRKFKVPKGIVHPLVFTKAESIAGYEKFTLDEVIYPGKEEKQVEAKERSDDVSEEDIVVVDTTELKKDDSAVSSNSKAKKVDVR